MHIWLARLDVEAGGDALTRTAAELRRRALSNYQAVNPSDWQFDTDERGKPHVAAPATDLQFSISHCPGWVACALARGRDLGVDVERPRPVRYEHLARRFFAAAEYQALAELAEDARPGLFFDLWTLKEAALKQAGLGLAGGLETAEFLLRGALIEGRDQAAEGRYWLWRLNGDVRLALCAPGVDSVVLFDGLGQDSARELELLPAACSIPP